jgi:hypothetical protein
VATEKSVLVAGVDVAADCNSASRNDVGVPVRPPDAANGGAFARRRKATTELAAARVF